MKNSLYLVAALALASCDRSEPTPAQKPIEPTTTSPSPATPEESAAKREMQPTASDSRWSKTWDRFTSSDQKKFEDDDYVIERAENGAVSAWRKTKAVAGEAKDTIADATIEAGVKSGLAASPDVRAHKIDVDVKDNVVHLEGKVGSAAEAGEAIRVTIGIPGVDKVVSHLTY